MHNIGLPEVIMICFMTFNLMTHFHKHGQKEEKEYNMYASVLAEVITLTVLIKGGFFN
jgi:hypothetical protein